MASIDSTLPAFTKALQTPTKIYANNDGVWRKENLFNLFIRIIFRLNDYRAKFVIGAFTTAMGRLETAKNQTGLTQQSVVEFLAAAKKIKQVYKRNSSPEIQKELVELRRQKHALKCRVGLVSKFHATYSDLDIANLRIHAQAWKNKQYMKEADKPLNPTDHERIDGLKNYPKLMYMLSQSEQLRDEFFNWTIRNHCSTDIFAVLPRLQTQIKVSYLASRLARDNGETLVFKRLDGIASPGKQFCDAELPFESQFVSALDENSEITCIKGTRSITLKKVYEVFKNKNYFVGNLEYFSRLKHTDTFEGDRFGICGHNIHKWGYWSDTLKRFVQDFLGVPHYWLVQRATERHTLEELQKAYPAIKIKESDFENGKKPWFKLLMASRTKDNLAPGGTHAWIKMIIPVGDKWNVYDYGKVMRDFPYWWWQFIKPVFHMNVAAYELPEQNIQYTHRVSDYLPRTIDEAEGVQTMEDIKTDWILSQEGKSYFNAVILSCANWANLRWNPPEGDAFKHLPSEHPFRMHYLDVNNTGFSGAFTRLMRKTHWTVHGTVYSVFGLFMGNWLGAFHTENGRTRYMSLLTHFTYDDKFYLPAMLINRVAEARKRSIKGV